MKKSRNAVVVTMLVLATTACGSTTEMVRETRTHIQIAAEESLYYFSVVVKESYPLVAITGRPEFRAAYQNTLHYSLLLHQKAEAAQWLLILREVPCMVIQISDLAVEARVPLPIEAGDAQDRLRLLAGNAGCMEAK